MKEVELSNREIKLLHDELNEAKRARKNGLLISVAYILGGLIYSYIAWSYFKRTNPIIGFSSIGVLVIANGVMVAFLTISYKPKKYINLISSDISCGLKVVGESEVMKFKLFKQGVELTDGTVINTADLPIVIAVGNFIYYEKTRSGEKVFFCKKSCPLNRS